MYMYISALKFFEVRSSKFEVESHSKLGPFLVGSFEVQSFEVQSVNQVCYRFATGFKIVGTG